ncbi:hypothetical protein Poly21_48110 [Allorhodopirellula heiligendammensis]|uniref:Uncharacterized protein n=1 Tax=Allorhodopirellula heiligendammensis TaxID=2714739 RepID=A0A5C6BFE4_9BACT|nr:hypothetical protein Poly21_48110 [Allorhodopirellula heiligendammensis]
MADVGVSKSLAHLHAPNLIHSQPRHVVFHYLVWRTSTANPIVGSGGGQAALLWSGEEFVLSAGTFARLRRRSRIATAFSCN